MMSYEVYMGQKTRFYNQKSLIAFIIQKNPIKKRLLLSRFIKLIINSPMLQRGVIYLKSR